MRPRSAALWRPSKPEILEQGSLKGVRSARVARISASTRTPRPPFSGGSRLLRPPFSGRTRAFLRPPFFLEDAAFLRPPFSGGTRCLRPGWGCGTTRNGTRAASPSRSSYGDEKANILALPCGLHAVYFSHRVARLKLLAAPAACDTHPLDGWQWTPLTPDRAQQANGACS